MFHRKKLKNPNAIDPHSGVKIFHKGRKSDRLIEDWEDKRQNAYLKKLEEVRKNAKSNDA